MPSVAIATMNSTAAHQRSGPSFPASASSIQRNTGAQRMRTIVIALGSCLGIATSRAYRPARTHRHATGRMADQSRPVSPQASSEPSSPSTTS